MKNNKVLIRTCMRKKIFFIPLFYILFIHLNILVFFLISVCSCSSPQKETVLSDLNYIYVDESTITKISKEDFKEQDVKQIRQIPLNVIMMNKEVDILVKNGYLVIKALGRYSGAKLINIFSEDGSKHIKELAPFGSGPDEFTDLRIIPTSDDDLLCYILSLHNKKLYALDNKLSLEYISIFPMPNNIEDFRLGVNDLYHLKTDEFLCQQRAENGLGICKININDSIVTGLVGLNFSESLDSFWQIYTGHTAYNPQKNLIAYSMSYFDRILLFNADNSHLKVIQCGTLSKLVSKSRSDFYNTGEEKTYYRALFSDENFFYALYKGEKRYSPDFDENGHYYIEKYDWEGNPVKRYKLPKGMGFYGGCSTNENNVFYLVCSHEDEFLFKVILE